MTEFNVKDVMNEIRKNIIEEDVKTEDLSFITSYYKKILKMSREAESLIIFGTGVYGKMIYDDFKLNGINRICCFCDNKPKSERERGVPVHTLDKCMELYPNATYVITPKYYENEIFRQLIKAGVDVDKIINIVVEETGLVIL